MGPSDTLSALGTQMIPQVWVVGTDGRIRWNFDAEGSLDAAIEDALSSSSTQVADRSKQRRDQTMTSVSGENITSVLQESRVFPPPAEFRAQANIKSEDEYNRMWHRAKDDPAGFWGEMAANLHWFRKWDKVLDGAMPNTKWFVGGKINASYNCLDRHLSTWRKNKAAIIWEGEPGDSRVLRYQDLHREVCRFANVLKKLGIKTGDRVTLYMPMVPELVIAMLACADRRHAFDHLRRFQRRCHRRPQQRRQVATRDHGRRRLAPRQGSSSQADRRRKPAEIVHHREGRRRPAHRLARHDGSRPRLLVARPDVVDVGRMRPGRARRRTSAVYPLHLRQHGKTQGRAAHDGRVSARHHDDVAVGLRSQGRRHLLVHGRRRLGDGAQLHRLRPAGQRRDRRHVRRSPQLAGRRPLLADHREVPGHHPLHGPHRDPRVHQVGRPMARKVRPVEPAAVGLGRRADQSRSLDVVSPGDRPGAVPDRRHLVADRNGRHHDQPAPGRHGDQAGKLHEAAAGRRARHRHQVGREPSRQPGRLPGDAPAVALDAADPLRRSRPVSQNAISARSRAAISPATAHGTTRTAITG